MFDDDGRLVAYIVRYRDEVIELKTRSVTTYIKESSNLGDKMMNKAV